MRKTEWIRPLATLESVSLPATNPPTTPSTAAAQNIARAALAERGIYLVSAVVISEDEYHNDYVVQPNQIAFVLPDVGRVKPLPNQSLLQTAELLMATTPNGI